MFFFFIVVFWAYIHTLFPQIVWLQTEKKTVPLVTGGQVYASLTSHFTSTRFFQEECTSFVFHRFRLSACLLCTKSRVADVENRNNWFQWFQQSLSITPLAASLTVRQSTGGRSRHVTSGHMRRACLNCFPALITVSYSFALIYFPLPMWALFRVQMCINSRCCYNNIWRFVAANPAKKKKSWGDIKLKYLDCCICIFAANGLQLHEPSAMETVLLFPAAVDLSRSRICRVDLSVKR